jgi:hypothetical protein
MNTRPRKTIRIPKRRINVPKNVDVLYLPGCERGILYDKKFKSKVREVRWRYDEARKRMRGFFGRGKTRQYLHRYLLELAGKHYPEVTFANGDWYDLRLVNLRPYDRVEDGSNRKMFKNRTKKGISWNKRVGKWAAMIRVRGKLHHLGYFTDPDIAAIAYHNAWKLAHPNL